MIESVSNLSIWQLLILTINIFIFTYFMCYIISKAFFSAYFKCKEKHILEVGKFVTDVRNDIEKTLPLINKEISKRNEVSNAGLEDQKESVHK